jgi:hypothetical protein
VVAVAGPEQDEAEQEDTLAAAMVADGPADDQQRRVHDHVGVDDPQQAGR